MTIDAIGLGLCTVDMLFVVDRQPTFDTTMRASQYLRQGGGPVPTSLVALALSAHRRAMSAKSAMTPTATLSVPSWKKKASTPRPLSSYPVPSPVSP